MKTFRRDPRDIKPGEELLAYIRAQLAAIGEGEDNRRRALRRWLIATLRRDERGIKDADLKLLKAQVWGLQGGKCIRCGQPLDLKHAHAHRISGTEYAIGNVALMHYTCHSDEEDAEEEEAI